MIIIYQVCNHPLTEYMAQVTLENYSHPSYVYNKINPSINLLIEDLHVHKLPDYNLFFRLNGANV